MKLGDTTVWCWKDLTRRFIFDDQIFKGLALRAPFVKLAGGARSPPATA